MDPDTDTGTLNLLYKVDSCRLSSWNSASSRNLRRGQTP
jgi:hypothetical protein